GLASLPHGLCITDADGRVAFANPAFRNMVGAPACGPLPPCAELLRALAESGRFGAGDPAALASEASGLTRGAGGMRLGQAEIIPVDGGLLICVGEKLEGILEHIPFGICVFGPDLRIAALNSAYAQVLHEPRTALGDRLEDLIRRRAARGVYGPGPIEELVAARLKVDRSKSVVRRRHA